MAMMLGINKLVTVYCLNPFIIRVAEDKEMFIISPGENVFGAEFNKISQFRDLYSTVLDLRNKIGYSLEKAIEYAYSDEVMDNYNMLHTSGNNEWLAYYFIENAMFRVETMWDILAHIYNIKYDLGEPIYKVYHSRIFSNKVRVLQRFKIFCMRHSIAS